MSEFTGASSATDGSSMQDITGRVEDLLYASPEAEVEQEDAEIVSEDAEELPEDDQIEADDEEAEVEQDPEGEEQTLAELLGVDEERVVMENGVASIETIIDGKTKAVPLSELVSSYQLQGHVNNKSMSLQDDRKAFDDTKLQAVNQLKQRVDGIANLGKALEEQLVNEFNSVDWDRLRTVNPAEWTALRQEYADKATKIQQAQDLAGQEQNRIMQEQQTAANEQRSKFLQDEMQKTIANNPTWGDQAVLAKAQGEIVGFMKESYGFNDEDMAAVADHRIIKLIQDAMSYRNGTKIAETKKVKAVPKFAKPGITKQKSAQLANARAAKAKRAAVKKTGKTQDIANLIVDRM